MAAASAEDVAQLRADLHKVSGELNEARSRSTAAPATGTTMDREKEMRQLLDSKILTKIETFKRW